MHKITERCYYFSGDHETDRPSLGYVRGERLSLAIDGGNSPAHWQQISSELAAAGFPQPRWCAVTHSHWDHVYGLCAMEAQVIACRRTDEQLRRMQGWQWNEDSMALRLETGEDILFCHEHILKEYADPRQIRVRTADLVFDERLTLDLGGVHAELIRLGNSHAEDCVVVYIPEEKVVFLGDITYHDLHHKPECWHLKRREKLIAALAQLDFAWAVPGHQEVKGREAFFTNLEEALAEDAEDGVLMLED